MSEIIFEEIDIIGCRTLQTIADADKFNKWMFNTIKPYCNGKILEIGSGCGIISKYFINCGFDLTLSDISRNYCNYLENYFSYYQYSGKNFK